MAYPPFGKPLERPSPPEIHLEPGDPGFGWEMSEETKRKIEEIENNTRQAMANAHKVIVG